MKRRNLITGIGTVAMLAVAGCSDASPSKDPENYDENLRHSYSAQIPDSGDGVVVNVDGRLGNEFDSTKYVTIEVRLYSGDELVRTKEITIPETVKKTDWGVAFVFEDRIEDVSVEADVVEVGDHK